MPTSRLRRIASRIDDGLDRARMELRRLTGLDDPVLVRLYRGHGTPSRLVVSGSVFVAEERERKTLRPALSCARASTTCAATGARRSAATPS